MRKGGANDLQTVRKQNNLYGRNLRTEKGDLQMSSKMYGYARVSTREQNLDRQILALKAAGVDERDIITDKQSGKDLGRQGYQTLRNVLLRRGDTLVIKSLDRLSRNKEDIKNELQYYKEAGVRLMICELPTTMIQMEEGMEWVVEMVNNILIEVLSSIAQQERETIRKRQREGIDAAQLQGKHLGRPKAERPDGWEEIYREYKAGRMKAGEAMRELGLKKSTFYKLCKLEE